MDQAWHSQVGERIRQQAEKAAVRHLVRMAYQDPDRWFKARDLAVEWKLLPEYSSHLMAVYARLNRKRYVKTHF